MPIISGFDLKGYFYKFGDKGKHYYYFPDIVKSKQRAYLNAFNQGSAIHISKQNAKKIIKKPKKKKLDKKFILKFD